MDGGQNVLGVDMMESGFYRFVMDILSSSYILTILHPVSWV